MYIGNVGIFVKDLKGARHFFENYFGAKLLKSYNEPENNYYSAFWNWTTVPGWN